MAAIGALVKKVWSLRRFLVLLCTPLVLLPVLLSLPPKVTPPGAATCPFPRAAPGSLGGAGAAPDARGCACSAPCQRRVPGEARQLRGPR